MSQKIAEKKQSNTIELYDEHGQRLYLTPAERESFAEAAIKHSIHDEARTFTRMLYYTGCRISEAVQLTFRRVDTANNQIVFRTLKRRKLHWRTVPCPESFMDELQLVHRLKQQRDLDAQLWPITRQTGYNWCMAVMNEIGLDGPHACPKGLRHGFGVAYALEKVSLPTLQKWMGHSDISMTAEYLKIVGDEERELAARLWK